MNIYHILTAIPFAGCLGLLIYISKIPEKKSEQFIITKSMHNRVDMTDFDTERKGAFVIEFENDKATKFINQSNQGQDASFGTIINFQADTIFEVDNNYKQVKHRFKWKFQNNYDKEKGIAHIEMTENISQLSTDFYLTMYLPATKEILIYWGYKQGSRVNVLTETIIR